MIFPPFMTDLQMTILYLYVARFTSLNPMIKSYDDPQMYSSLPFKESIFPFPFVGVPS